MTVSRREVLATPLVALADEGGLEGRVQRLEKMIAFLGASSPPVGSIIAYLGEWPAEGPAREKWEDDIGWMLCDGRPVEGEKYAELRKVYKIRTLPSFDGRVPRGKLKNQKLADQQGSDKTAEKTKTDKAGDHSHTLPAWTGLLGIFPNNLTANGKRYSIKDDNRGWVANQGGNAHHLEVGGGPNDEGQHRHELGGNTGGHGGHEHMLPRLDIVPSYVAVNFIIRFRSIGLADFGK